MDIKRLKQLAMKQLTKEMDEIAVDIMDINRYLRREKIKEDYRMELEEQKKFYINRFNELKNEYSEIKEYM